MRQPSEYIQSELPAIELFQKMGYAYLDANKNDERADITEVILTKRLLESLRRINPWINEQNLHKAYSELTSILGASLMEINEKAWELLRGGTYVVKQIINGVEGFHAVHFIDYEDIETNDFLIVNQMKFKGLAQNSIPDLVVYINGLPIGVIECKSPSAQNSWDKAYGDLKHYQENSEKLFHFNQICCGIWRDNGKYGAIGAPQQFYSYFKTSEEDELSESGETPTEQDKLLYSIFRKDRVLDIIRHFVLFELEEGRTIKKLPRYQQLRATNKTIKRLQAGEGGVVWHTQGSGKSLTMAYVARKLQAPEFGFDNPTVVIMTDRKDLDRQITTTFQNVGFKNVHQASSVVHLDKLLSNDYGGIITTTLQKFQETDLDATDNLDQTEIEEHENVKIVKELNGTTLTKITKILENGKWVEIERHEIELEELSKKENLYIMVDEAHRSHYGFLASFMRTVLPNAKFIAFTGTPISKEDKSTLGEFYGGDYIDVYTINQAVEDGATVKLLYDEGIAKLDVKKKELDAHFEAEFGDASEEKKDKLKREALRRYQLSDSRIDAISRHIVDHYQHKIYPNKHKAMIVCSGRQAALKYQQKLQALRDEGVHNFESKVVLSIGSPKSDAIAKEYYATIEWNRNNPSNQKPVWVVPPEEVKDATDQFKLPFGDEAETQKSGNKKYDNTAFMIVSDMLLTGWDAPIASCLYLDKPLKEHNLLQAIARVNRSRKSKDAGFIVDYNGITAHLIQALEIFSGDIRPDDILKNINEEFPQLEMNHTRLVDFFRPLKIDRNYERAKYIDAAIRFIEPIDRRDDFKTFLKDFNKSVNIVLPNTKAMKFYADFKLFNEIKVRAKNTYPDDDGLKISPEESYMLQAMIDEHLHSEGVKNLLNEPVSIMDKEKFMEEIMHASPASQELKMRNNLKHTIKVGLDRNPDFYKPLAQRLDELLKLKEAKRIDEAQLLIGYGTFQDEIIAEQREGEAKGFTTERQRAVYNSMKSVFNETAEDATKTLFDLINKELNLIGWESKGQVRNDIENKIMRFLKTKMDRTEAKEKAKEMLNVLMKNSDA